MMRDSIIKLLVISSAGLGSIGFVGSVCGAPGFASGAPLFTRLILGICILCLGLGIGIIEIIAVYEHEKRVQRQVNQLGKVRE